MQTTPGLVQPRAGFAGVWSPWSTAILWRLQGGPHVRHLHGCRWAPTPLQAGGRVEQLGQQPQQRASGGRTCAGREARGTGKLKPGLAGRRLAGAVGGLGTLSAAVR